MSDENKTKEELIREIETLKTELKAEKLNKAGIFNYKKLFDYIENSLLVIDLSGKIKAVNKFICERLGYPEKEMIGEYLAFIFQPENAEKSVEKILSTDSEKKLSLKVKLLNKKGNIIESDANTYYAVWDEQPAIFLVIKDLSITDEKLFESELKWKNYIRVSPYAVFVVDEVGNYREVNESACKMTDYTENELLKMNITNLVAPDFLDFGLQKFAELKQSGKMETELILVTKNGERKVVYLSVILLNKGNSLGIAVDITDRKKMEESLRESNNRLSLAVKASSVGIWEYNLANNNLIWDEQMFNLYDTAKEDFFGRYTDWLEKIHPEDRDKSNKQVQIAMKGEKELDLEFRIICSNGKERSLRGMSKLVRDDSGKPVSMIGTNWDITEQKKSEKLQELLIKIAEKYINLPLENLEAAINQSIKEMGQFAMADRVYIFDYDFVKDTCSNTYEWCEEGVSAEIKNLQDVTLEIMPKWVETHKKGEVMYYPDVEAISSEGEDAKVKEILQQQNIKSILAIPMINNDELMGFVGFDSVKSKHIYSDKEQVLLGIFAQMLVNIKIRINNIDQLSKAKELAESGSKAKSEFLANMSHELRTPLNGVVGFTELLSQTPLDEVQKQYAENINISGKALLDIINDILDFSKIEAGRLDLEISDTNLKEIINQTVDIIKFPAEKKHIELLINLPDKFPEIGRFDSIRLKQVLINLLNNAVKFTEKGEVEIKVEFKDFGEGRGAYTFWFRDTGIGISEEQKKKLFKAFSQADGSITRKFGGTGLGLIISSLLIQKMGGKIKLESEYGSGSVFYFTIETFYQPESLLEPESLPELQKALLIDDNKNSLKLLKNILEKWGVECTTCENGIFGLQILEEKAYDLLLVDYDMPYLNGMETIRIIREKLENKEMKIILLQNSTEAKNLEEEGKKLNIFFNLNKPIRKEELHKLLKNLRNNQEELKEDKQKDKKEILAHLVTKTTILITEDVDLNMLLLKTVIKKFLPEAILLEAHNGQEAILMFEKYRPEIILMDVQMPILDGIRATQKIREKDRKIPIIAITAGVVKEEKEAVFASGMNDYITKPLNPKELKEKLEKYLPGKFIFE